MSGRNEKKIIMENSRAKNFVGSSCDRISGGWINRWSEIVNREPGRCSFYGCSNDAEVGGHLDVNRRSEEYYYIAPICKQCNGSSEKKMEYHDMKKNTAYLKIERNPCTR